jgi:glycosyl transferase family 25
METRVEKMNAIMPRILLICDPSSDRGVLARKRLDAIGLGHEVSPAVFPPAERPWSTRYDEAARVNACGYPMVRGEVGCFLAHRDAWRRVAEGTEDVVLIMEDDATLAAPDVAAIQALASAPQLRDKLTLLFTVSRPRFRRWLRAGPASLAIPAERTYSTVAYLLGRNAAPRLLAASETFSCPVDEFLNLEYRHGVTLLVTVPLLAGHLDDAPSLIGARTKPRLSDIRRLRRNCHRLIGRLRNGARRLLTLARLGLLFAKVEKPAG